MLVGLEGTSWFSSSLHQHGPKLVFPRKMAEAASSLRAPVTGLYFPSYLASNFAFTLLQRKARGPQEGRQLEGTVVHLDVHSLAQLQRDNIPATDDSPKYSYKLGQHGQYGKCQDPMCWANSA